MCELDPEIVLYNLLRHPLQAPPREATENEDQTRSHHAEGLRSLVRAKKLGWLSQMHLLKKKHFELPIERAAFDCHGDVGWAICVCGCAPRDGVYFARTDIDASTLEGLREEKYEKPRLIVVCKRMM